tara:strand:+ start:72 stop:242 length:171 start_codon:yes stop_codon:yes gene_type:complete
MNLFVVILAWYTTAFAADPAPEEDYQLLEGKADPSNLRMSFRKNGPSSKSMTDMGS